MKKSKEELLAAKKEFLDRKKQTVDEKGGAPALLLKKLLVEKDLISPSDFKGEYKDLK